MTNSVDPDQMLHSAASDLGLHCLQRPVCPNIKAYYVIDMYRYVERKSRKPRGLVI